MENTIIEASKVGSKLVFKKGENVLEYDFKDKKFIKNNKKELLHPQSFFRGYSLGEVIGNKEEKVFKFIQRVANFEDKCRNIGTFLDRLVKYQKIEAWFYLDIRTDIRLKYLPSEINKKVINFIKKYDIRIDNNFLEKSKNDNFIKIIDFLEDNKFSFLDFTREILYNSYENIISLINMRYDYKALLLYLDKITRYEAMSLSSATRLLLDYANMQAKISKNGKYEKYPIYLHTTHDIITRNYNLFKQEYNEELFKEKINLDLEYSSKEYKIIVPKCTQDVKDEGMNLKHCVGSYIDKIIEGTSYIVFLRKDIDKSLVTIEIIGKDITQAKGELNRALSQEEMDILVLYAKNKKLKIGGRL